MSDALRLGFVARAVSLAALMTALALPALAQQKKAPAVQIDKDDIGGVVTGASGPEAGVWVIAETKDLKTRYAKMVVTDDQGRYLVPDLPKGNYSVWVRGYGLVDSAKTKAAPGQIVNLKAKKAPNDAAAAKYYPAIYWYSMMKIPPKSDFDGQHEIPKGVTQERYLNTMKNNGCIGCHQLGNLATRTIPKGFGHFDSMEEAWMRRIQSGQAGMAMNATIGTMGGVPIHYLADWTERVAKGELPKAKPPRPSGVERNIVVTVRDWLDQKHYLHDAISTDRRNPTVNGYGTVYGTTEYSVDLVPTMDPVKNVAGGYKAPYRDKNTPIAAVFGGNAASGEILAPSAYWGEEKIWTSHINMHNPMIDENGKVWFTSAIRGNDNPSFCKKGSDLESAQVVPLNASGRQISVWDPKTGEYKFVDTCFGTHHLQFDKQDRLWTSGGGPVVGWVDAKKFLATGDAEHSQGWTPLVLDTNGNGKRDDYVEADQPVDPTKDKRIVAPFYAVMPNPADGSVWGAQAFGVPGRVIRIAPGDDPAKTALAEVYNVAAPGFGPRGGDIDSKGVVWVSLASGHLGSFDRSKCKGPLNGPTAMGDQCPEGWTFYQYPGPGFDGIGENSAESSYYSWVDQHNTFGLGDDVPMSTGNLNDGLIALKDGKMVTLRVPYPMGFYAKGFDGRIDDANAGWKGRGLWATSGDRTPWLHEGGKGSKPMLVHFQIRPDPLAK